MTEHDHDYRPGWTYLNGQHKPKYLLDAITAAEDAWDAYHVHVENMVVMSKTGDENEINKMNSMLAAACELDEYQRQMYHRWQDEIRHGIEITFPANVKASAVN